MDIQQALAAIGEPTRYRIVRLLAVSPLTVGEVAAALGALQPQTTKHLQALEAAGLVRIHALGRRRVVRLDRDGLSALAEALRTLAATIPAHEETALDDYEHGIESTPAALIEAHRQGRDGGLRTTIELYHTLDAPAQRAWEAWTTPALAARWWAPPHYTVVSCLTSAVPGEPVRLVLREEDGAEYTSEGRVIAAEPGRRLVWDQSPLDDAGAPLFESRLTLTLADGAPTRVGLRIDAVATRAEAAPALAGLRPSWESLLTALTELLRE